VAAFFYEHYACHERCITSISSNLVNETIIGFQSLRANATKFHRNFVARLALGGPQPTTKPHLNGEVLCYLEAMYYVYMLLSEEDGRTYVGYTNDIERRLQEHKNGQVEATEYRRPLKLFHLEKFQSKQEAKEREQWYKSSSGRNKIKELFEEKNL
jgi:putative endonuclease